MDDAPVSALTTNSCWLCGGDARTDEQYRSVSFYRCDSCGFLFAPERSETELHEIYTDNYFVKYAGEDSYSEDEVQRRYEARSRLSWIKGKVSKGRLMEVGAANGTFLDEARSGGFEVFGIEPAAGLAEQARTRFGVEVETGFVESATIPEEPFDVVCAWHVLEHIRQPQASLTRLREAMRPDGLLFLEIPNIESVRALRYGTRWIPLKPEAHVGFYSRKQLADVLEQSGFRLLEAFSVSALSYYRPRLAMKPWSLVIRAYDMYLSRTLQGRPHPYKHELLRAVAQPL